MDIVKIGLLFVAIWMTIINVARLYNKVDISTINFFLQAFGITGFVVLQWLI